MVVCQIYCNRLKFKDLPEYAQTNFAIFVEVWIETNLSISCGHQLDSRWPNWIIWWAADQKIEISTFVRCIKGSRNQSMDLEQRENLTNIIELQTLRPQQRANRYDRSLTTKVWKWKSYGCGWSFTGIRAATNNWIRPNKEILNSCEWQATLISVSWWDKVTNSKCL